MSASIEKSYDGSFPRTVVTDHGDFVLINVYVPNEGDNGERRGFKCKFLVALKDKADEFRARGKKVRVVRLPYGSG